MHRTYDTIVVGARAAGAATALLLARRGQHVLVVERGERGSDTLSTHALMRAGVLQLDRWGLLDEVVAAGTPAVRQVTFQYDDEQVVVPIKPIGGVDALYAPRRTVLDPIVADAAAAAGAEVRYGVTVTDLVEGDDGRVAGVRGRDRDGRPFEARARLTVGADGARSFVARRVDAPVTRTSDVTGAVAYRYLDGVAHDGYRWIYRPGLSGGVIPTNGGTLAWVGMAPARFRTDIRPDVAPGFRRLFAEVAPDLAHHVDAAPDARIRTSPGLNGFMRRPWGPGWALVGDAGHFKDPISAHGITDAFLDAELLAAAIVAAAGGADEAEALWGYERLRDSLSEPLFAAIDAIAGYDWTMAEIRDLLHAASRAMQHETEHLIRLHDEMAEAA